MNDPETPAPSGMPAVPDGNPQPGAPPPPPFDPHSDLITDMERSPERDHETRRRTDRA